MLGIVILLSVIFRCKPQSDVLLFFVVCVFQVKEEEKTCEVNPQSDVFAVCFYLCMLLAGEVAIIKLWHLL